jgi:hypothetical protein
MLAVRPVTIEVLPEGGHRVERARRDVLARLVAEPEAGVTKLIALLKGVVAILDDEGDRPGAVAAEATELLRPLDQQLDLPFLLREVQPGTDPLVAGGDVHVLALCLGRGPDGFSSLSLLRFFRGLLLRLPSCEPRSEPFTLPVHVGVEPLVELRRDAVQRAVDRRVERRPVLTTVLLSIVRTPTAEPADGVAATVVLESPEFLGELARLEVIIGAGGRWP